MPLQESDLINGNNHLDKDDSSMKILNGLDQSEKSASFNKEHIDMHEHFMDEDMEELRRQHEQ